MVYFPQLYVNTITLLMMTFCFHRALTSSEKISMNVEEEGTTQCLVAIARLQPFSRQAEPEGAVVDGNADTEFVARVGLDGKFTYIDHRSVDHDTDDVCTCVWLP